MLFAIIAVAACTAARPRGAPERQPPKIVTSNVSRADYAGTAACAPCHHDIVERWAQSPMHRMTRAIDETTVDAPFDGTVFRFKRDHVTLETHGRGKYMRLDTVEKGSALYRVTKVIGGKHREDFAGVEVEAPTEAQATGIEKILPVSFMRATKSLRYKGYSVMDAERPGLRASGEWRKRCIFCHNTVPYFDVLLGALGGDRKPYQGVVVDPLLPPDRRASTRIVDDELFRDDLHTEIRRLDPAAAVEVARATTRDAAIDRAVSAIRGRFDGGDLLEIGIGCESCHGGAREHADDPRTKPSAWPRAPWLEVAPPAGTDARAQGVSRMCARCHQVLFSAYGWTWEGARRNMVGVPDHVPGGSNINSGEGRDFLLGGCASRMTCTDCHDPHASAGVARSGNEICTRCHESYRDEAAQRAHAHHDPRGAGGACVACHMPRKNMGLAGRLVRYHRIGSPNEPARILGDRPIECALCHPNQTVGALVDTIESWWGRRFDREALRGLYGSLDASPILATLDRGKPHEQAVAIAVAGERHLRPAVPFLLPHATHPVPLLRYWTLDALSEILGAPSPVDLHQENAQITKQTRAWIEQTGFAMP